MDGDSVIISIHNVIFFFFLGNLIGGVLNGDACQSCQPLIVF